MFAPRCCFACWRFLCALKLCLVYCRAIAYRLNSVCCADFSSCADGSPRSCDEACAAVRACSLPFARALRAWSLAAVPALAASPPARAQRPGTHVERVAVRRSGCRSQCHVKISSRDNSRLRRFLRLEQRGALRSGSGCVVADCDYGHCSEWSLRCGDRRAAVRHRWVRRCLHNIGGHEYL